MQRKCGSRILLYVTTLVFLTGLACLIAGIILVVRSNNDQLQLTKSKPDSLTWGYSEEARSVGLDKLLQRVQDDYFNLYPNKIASKPDATPNIIKEKYRPYDPTPSSIKYITDASKALLRELDSLPVSPNKLKQFEKRALAQAKFWVYHVFAYGVPYGYDYYTGDWLMGPDLFCWAPICHIDKEMSNSLKHFKPSNVMDFVLFRKRLMDVERGIRRYKNNLQLGVAAGMVRSIEECEGGLNAFRNKFMSIYLNGEKGVLNADFMRPVMNEEFLSNLTNKPDESQKWQIKYGKSLNDSLKEFLKTHVGRPIHELINYLETNYTTHCVSSNISSGMSSLPLRHIYVNNKLTTPTTTKLPTGEPLNGKRSYSKLLSYFTTSNITADELHTLGFSLLESLYGEVLQLAREISGEKNNDTAKARLQVKLDEASNYFNEKAIPANESDNNAYKLCYSMESAKINCPVRWKAMMNWFQYVRQLTTLLDSKLLKLFHMVGPKTSVPSCPVEAKADFNPTTPAPTYLDSNPECSRTAKYTIPFFLQKPGPKSDQWTTSAHEVKPGHHLQIQTFNEQFSSEGEGVARWLSNSLFFLAFSEGWALYAEDPLIARETDMYKNQPLMRFGALKWQVVRAIRLILDTGLHSKGMSRAKALQMLRDYTWDNTDIPAKEITRYQSVPAQSVSYMVGKLRIMKARNEAKARLGKKFNIKDFHFHILRNGASPFGYLEEAVGKYVSCVLNEKEDGCEGVLSPTVKRESSSKPRGNELENAHYFYPTFFGIR